MDRINFCKQLLVKTSLVFLMFSVFVFNMVVAANVEQKIKSSDLEKIIAKIDKVRKGISRDHVRQDKLREELKVTEISLSKINKNLEILQHDLARKKIVLNVLYMQQTELESKLTKQRAAIASDVRLAYMSNRQSFIKTIFNAENPQQLNAMLTYYGYVNTAKANFLRKFKQGLQQLETNKKEILQQQEILQALQTKQSKQQQNLQAQQKRRQQVIAKINQRLVTNAQRLQALMSDRKALIDTLQRLSLQHKQTSDIPFSQLKGRLDWPTQGSLVKSYHNSSKDARIKLNGIVIKAPLGQPIYATDDGRVVFANWLRGLGLLLIVDHGDGYLTLYGHAQNLYKSAGDSVYTGDLIATVGQSGGQSQPALYFAIRHDGSPLNPLKWLKYA